MKYFTPELIDAYGSDDPIVADKADETWERLGEQYCSYLQSVKDFFPPGLKHIEDSYHLHDADVHGIGRASDQFIFYMRLDPPPQSLLTFRYLLVEEPVIDRNALPESARMGGLPMWQYDELELVPGDPPTWRQSILLSNGWEIALHFRDIEVEEVLAILPAPRHQSSSPVSDLSQTA